MANMVAQFVDALQNRVSYRSRTALYVVVVVSVMAAKCMFQATTS